jgi:hypothetical protein
MKRYTLRGLINDAKVFYRLRSDAAFLRLIVHGPQRLAAQEPCILGSGDFECRACDRNVTAQVLLDGSN